MSDSILIAIAGIIVLGVSAQWIAWRIGLPSILLLLTFGIIAGPLTGWIRPGELFPDDLFFPVVSLAVALILYEGGLSLKVSELPKVGSVVRNLVSIGALLSWGIGALAAHVVLGLDVALSALLGAILVVTGPTVIGPLLRQIRPAGVVGPVLKWEGIVIDPIGALAAVLIYEAILIGEAKEASIYVALGVLKTLMLGSGIGLAAAGLLVLMLARYWIADHLQNAASLMLVLA
ncbi:MAG: cation:proton antiporter, partial [Phycisphaerae bacterium]